MLGLALVKAKSFHDAFMFVDIVEAQRLTGKSYSSIRRWVSSDESRRKQFDSTGNISVDELKEHYPFKTEPEWKKNESNNVEALELANTQTQLVSFREQLNSQQETINKLIDKQNRTNPWAILTIIAVFISCLTGFIFYRNELIQQKNLERDTLVESQQQIFAAKQESFEAEKQSLTQQLEFQRELDATLIKQLRTENEQLKTELTNLDKTKNEKTTDSNSNSNLSSID